MHVKSIDRAGRARRFFSTENKGGHGPPYVFYVDFGPGMHYTAEITRGRDRDLPTKIVTAAVIREGDDFLIAQRRSDDEHGLAWEFPGGSQEEGEDPRETLAREIGEELGVTIEVGRVLETLFHRYPDFDMLLIFYRCQILSGSPAPIECRDVRWVRRADLEGYPFMPADMTFIRRLVRGEMETPP